MALSAAKVKTTNLSARSMPDGYATVHIVLEVKDQASSPASSTSWARSRACTRSSGRPADADPA